MNPTEYYLKIQELTPVNEPVLSASNPPVTDFGFLPIWIFLIVFILGLGMLIIKHLLSLKSAFLVTAFAASMSFVTLSTQTINQTTRLESQASSATTPKNVTVILDKEVFIQWRTDEPTTGGIVVSTSPDFDQNRQIIPQNYKDWQHSLKVPLIHNNKTYYLKVFSGSRWYDNQGEPITLHLP